MNNEIERHKKDADKYRELFNSLNEITELDQYINKFIATISVILAERTMFVDNSNNDVEINKFYKILKEHVKKLYIDNSCIGNPSDNIEFIGTGHTSLAFRIGNNVLKVGKTPDDKKKRKNKISNCLVPLLVDECYKVAEKEFYTIEIAPLVDTKDISEEELYSAYKSLRRQGYIWNDPRPDNVGRIMSDCEINGTKYKKGDLVIIDLEDIAFVGETTSDEILEEISISSYNRRTYSYETRYIEERSRSTSK